MRKSLQAVVPFMKKHLIFAIIAAFVSIGSHSTANAYTCQQVRAYAALYGVPALVAWAKARGATAQQIRQGGACLRGGHRTARGATIIGSKRSIHAYGHPAATSQQ